MSRVEGYAPADYDAMLADPVRTPAYLAAIAHVVGPTDIVVEIGTGVGYFAVAASRAGAKHVYAIEQTASIALAESIVLENGCAGRVTCVRGDANTVDLPERGTVLLSDLRGVTPLHGPAIPTIAAARERLCVPGVRVIPRTDTIFAAPCEAPRNWRETELALGAAWAGISRLAAKRVARSTLHRDRIEADGLLARGAVLTVVDYRRVASPDVDASVEWAIERDGTAEGLLLWFEAELADGVRFTTEPGAPRTVYSNGFLPFERPLRVAPGDTVSCRLRAKLVHGAYVFAWNTTLDPATGGRDQIAMRQSTLTGLLVPPRELMRRRATHEPAPKSFDAVRHLLSLVDGQRTLAAIAAEVKRRDPARFSTDDQALRWVCSALASAEDLSQP